MPPSKSCKRACRRVRRGEGFSNSGAVAFLRRRYPSATALNVQADTTIAGATVDNWLRERSRIGADHLGLLIEAYGADFLAAAFPVARPWLEAEGMKRDLAAAIENLRDAAQRAAELAE